MTTPGISPSPDLLAALCAHIPEIIWAVHGTKRTAEWVSAAVHPVLGYEQEQLIGTRPIDLVIPDDAQVARDAWEQACAEGDSFCHYRLRRAEGGVVWCEASFRQVPDTPHQMIIVERDVSERIDAEGFVAQRERVHHAMLTAIDQPTVFISPAGRVISANPAFARLFRTPIAQLHGADITAQWSDWRFTDERGEILGADEWPVSLTLSSGAPVRGQLMQLHPPHGRKPRWVTLSSQMVGDLPHPDGVIVTVNDITAVMDARRRAERSAEATSQFLATMSHEIRTPMNGIIGLVEVLGRTGLSDEQAQLVRMVEGSAEALLRIVNDVLDHSRLEAGRLAIEEVDFCPAQVLEESRRLFTSRAHARGNELMLSLDMRLDSVWRTDPGRLAQIVHNLLDNAIKFTTDGQVRLEAELGSSHEDSVDLVVRVRDTGMGISAESQVRLFDAFTQGDGGRRFGGSGLGLSICQRLAGLLGGGLAVESTPGAGSCFTLRVPLHPAAGDGRARAGGRGAEPPRIDARALVVDDNPTNAHLAVLQLRDLGARVHVARSGTEALDILARERFDVILLDWQMPEMDGFEVTARLRALGDPTPIVAVTASALPGDRERCLAAGMNDYLPKPLLLEPLAHALLRVLNPHPDQSERVSPESNT